MFSFFRQTFQEWARSGTRAGAPLQPQPRLQCEALEDRMLLSLTGAQLFAHSLPAADHAIVATSGGHSVVAWTIENSPINHDIKAQLFDASGHKVGGVVTVAGGSLNQYSPAVAVNARGDFVVAWDTDFSLTDNDVHAALFRANGSRVKEVVVADTPRREYDASVGIDARDDFVVSYTVQIQGSDTDVKAVLYNASANPVRSIDVASTTRAEGHSHVSMASNGAFSISYVSGSSTLVSRYTSAGLPVSVLPPPPHLPPPPPPPAPSLGGMLAGGYVAAATGPDRAPRYDLAAIGSLSGLGQVMVTGDLFSTGFTRTGHASGELFLRGAGGTVTLDVTGPQQGAFAALPQQFHYTVESGTGSFAHLHASGALNVHLFPSFHTLTLDLVPQSA